MTSTLLRILWFVFVGWWFGIIWLGCAFALCLTIIGIPMGTAMALKTPTIMFLD